MVDLRKTPLTPKSQAAFDGLRDTLGDYIGKTPGISTDHWICMLGAILGCIIGNDLKDPALYDEVVEMIEKNIKFGYNSMLAEKAARPTNDNIG